MQTFAPASVSSAALYGMASNASTLYAHQSENVEALAPCDGDLGGDLVALQDVLERLDPHAVFLGGAEQHQDLVAPVAVAVDPDRAVEDPGQGLEPQVGPRGGGPAFAESFFARPPRTRPRSAR